MRMTTSPRWLLTNPPTVEPPWIGESSRVPGGHDRFLDAMDSIRSPLAQVEELLEQSMASEIAPIGNLLAHVAAFGGKRLRPMLVLLAAHACGKVDTEAIRAAAVVELVHAATLVHDDILDASPTRRHRPSLHRISDPHASLLIGDWLFTQAYALANQSDSTIPGRWVAAAAKEVCEGEFLQHRSMGNEALTLGEYYQILEAKTGSLCGVSCRLGAWSADGNSAWQDAYEAFGRKLGLAFQLHDDWLDYWGDPARMGKPVGSDFSAGKPTLPMIRFLELHPELQRMALPSAADRGEEAFRIFRHRLDELQIGGYTRQTAQQFSRDAIQVLRHACPNQDFSEFEYLASVAVARGT